MESEDSFVNDVASPPSHASFVSVELAATPRATRSSSNGRAWASWKRAVSAALPAASKRKMSLFSAPRPPVKPERLSQSAKMPAVSSASAPASDFVPTSAAVQSYSEKSHCRELVIHPSVYAHLQFMAHDDVKPASSSTPGTPQAHETCRSKLNALVLDVPQDMPLIRYLAECLLQKPPPSQAQDLTEWQLFFKCLHINKWSICQILAERMRPRQVQAGLQQRSSIITTRSDRAVLESNRSSMTDNQAQAAVEVMLSSFLNQCSA